MTKEYCKDCNWFLPAEKNKTRKDICVDRVNSGGRGSIEIKEVKNCQSKREV